ncbi:MAG: response regulator transcription factor [Ktedonobacteraceae bacterium]
MVQMMENHPLQFAQQADESERCVQVMIIDAHLLIREVLQQVIGSLPHVHVYASLNQVQDGPAVLKKGEGDVLILGSSVTTSDCLECVKVAHHIQPSLGIVVIRQQLCPETSFPIIKSGVQCLLGEDASAQDLARAIAAASTGSTFLSQGARAILNGYVSHVPLHFTGREMEVLPLLRLGLSNFCMAQRLGLKEKTVEKHLTHIYEKLHIRSRTEAMLRIQALHI